MPNELKEILLEERKLYIPHIKSLKNIIMAKFTRCEEYQIFMFISALRQAEYYKSRNYLCYIWYLRKTNILAERCGYFISPGVLGKGVRLFHQGGVIINLHSVIGDGCLFHGDNCVGNNGIGNLCPVLGRRVELGIGAKVIGNVTLADDIKVGANSVVTRSFLEPGITIAGIPAEKIKDA
jgi:serine O-acetyltransferase